MKLYAVMPSICMFMQEVDRLLWILGSGDWGSHERWGGGRAWCYSLGAAPGTRRQLRLGKWGSVAGIGEAKAMRQCILCTA